MVISCGDRDGVIARGGLSPKEQERPPLAGLGTLKGSPLLATLLLALFAGFDIWSIWICLVFTCLRKQGI